MKSATIQRVTTPTAVLVALSDDLATACSATLGDCGLRVLRAHHLAAASERIPVVMPQLVVASTELRAQEEEILRDRCIAVGAALLCVGPETDGELEVKLAEAAKAALVRATRPVRPPR